MGTLVAVNDETLFSFASEKASVDEKGRTKGSPMKYWRIDELRQQGQAGFA